MSEAWPDAGPNTLLAARRALRDVVVAHGLLRLDEPLRLASGAMSCDFVDAKRALARGRHLRMACDALVELARGGGVDFDAVGGLTMGADQFAHGVAVHLGGDTRWFVVRKAPKERGTNRLLEGAELGPGVRVLLVEDVVTTGGSISRAADAVRATGAEVVMAVALVDRGELARTQLARERVPYQALLTYRDLGIEPVGPAGSG